MQPTALRSPPPASLKCPVCNAGFRGEENCPRCGTGLGPLMLLAARAWALRERCRVHLLSGDLSKALGDADKAWQIQRKPAK